MASRRTPRCGSKLGVPVIPAGGPPRKAGEIANSSPQITEARCASRRTRRARPPASCTTPTAERHGVVEPPATDVTTATREAFKPLLGGKAQWRHYQPTPAGSRAAADVCTQLWDAIDPSGRGDASGLALHYQPIVGLTRGATWGYEALLRWTPPGGEPMPQRRPPDERPPCPDVHRRGHRVRGPRSAESRKCFVRRTNFAVVMCLPHLR